MPTTAANMNRAENAADFDDIKQDIADLKNDLARLASDSASTSVAAIKEGATITKDAVTDMTERASERAGEMHESLGTAVSKRPVTSLALAFAAGAVISRLVRK